MMHHLSPNPSKAVVSNQQQHPKELRESTNSNSTGGTFFSRPSRRSSFFNAALELPFRQLDISDSGGTGNNDSVLGASRKRTPEISPKSKSNSTSSNNMEMEKQPINHRWTASDRAQRVGQDRELQSLLAAEVDKSGFVTTSGYKAVLEKFLYSNVVEHEMNRAADADDKRTKSSGGGWISSMTASTASISITASNISETASNLSSSISQSQRMMTRRWSGGGIGTNWSSGSHSTKPSSSGFMMRRISITSITDDTKDANAARVCNPRNIAPLRRSRVMDIKSIDIDPDEYDSDSQDSPIRSINIIGTKTTEIKGEQDEGDVPPRNSFSSSGAKSSIQSSHDSQLDKDSNQIDRYSFMDKSADEMLKLMSTNTDPPQIKKQSSQSSDKSVFLPWPSKKHIQREDEDEDDDDENYSCGDSIYANPSCASSESSSPSSSHNSNIKDTKCGWLPWPAHTAGQSEEDDASLFANCSDSSSCSTSCKSVERGDISIKSEELLLSWPMNPLEYRRTGTIL